MVMVNSAQATALFKYCNERLKDPDIRYNNKLYIADCQNLLSSAMFILGMADTESDTDMAYVTEVDIDLNRIGGKANEILRQNRRGA